MNQRESIVFNRVVRRAGVVQPQMTKRMLAAYELIKSALTKTEMTRLLNVGALDSVIYALTNDSVIDPALAPLRAMIQRSTMNEAEAWSGVMPNWAQASMFNMLSPRIIDAVQGLETRVIDGLKSQIRETVRDYVMQGIEDGVNPRLVAKGLTEVIGLNSQQVKAIKNFREELKGGDRSALNRALGQGVITTPDGGSVHRAAHAGGKGLTENQLDRLDRKLGKTPLTLEEIDKAVNAYRQRMLALNTEANTKSIALDSQRLAQRMSWENSIDQGIVEEERLRRIWVDAGDDRVRPEHEEMNGEEIGFNDTYSNGDSIPGESDYGCRCVELIIYV